MNFIPRNAGDPKQTRQAMLEQKLRRLNELNNNLRHELQRERIPVSQAARSIIAYTDSTYDPLIPAIWGRSSYMVDDERPKELRGCSCVVM